MTLNHDNPRHVEADARLRAEPIAWLTVVAGSGQPQSTPIWFLWDGSEFLIYGSKNGPKTANIEAHPQVSLHLEGNGTGGGIVIFEGTARVDTGAPKADAVAEYVTKYQGLIESNGWTPEGFAADYPHAIRVTPTRARIW